ncbi:CDP-glycerol glycerophosphotransferase family protein [Rothia sp. CCM 9418]|uniref:CDP-glycerol glycerophosphotransferase family protein n=1 Tax=Rothia sp. CCM 9418 TaxID=3402661 RepID=UPI003AE9A6E7
MPAGANLLTVIVESPNGLDKESELYRRLVSAHLFWEDRYSIEIVEDLLNTATIKALCSRINSKYVVFMKDTHRISLEYMPTLLETLDEKTEYLVEPKIYMGEVPALTSRTKIDNNYFYNRDTDIFGIAYNTKRLAELLEIVSDLDRSSLYITYRLYWSINSASRIDTGYSVSSVTKVAIGIVPEQTIDRMVPLISTTCQELRLYILRLLILSLRGLRGSKKSTLSIGHIRELIRFFGLEELSSFAEALNPFELGMFNWFADPNSSRYLFKQLAERDAYLEFPSEEERDESYYHLYSIEFPEQTVEIGRSYLPKELRVGRERPGSYDFYSRPIRPNSTIIFYDRPMQADDNAEHLYDYFTKNYPEYSNVYFALNKKSPDWERLEEKGFKLIPFFSDEFYEKFLISDLVVASQIYNISYRGKTLQNSRFVYLQHGIQLNDMTDWILSKHFDIFVATGKIEADYLSKLAAVETLNSGIPRLETLAQNMKDPEHLLFMPTWRFNLQTATTESFLESDYFKSINGIMTNPKLLEYLEKHDKKLLVQLHPNTERRVDCFEFSERVVLSDLSYSEAIASAEMVFTDYSSVVLDAAFVGIPIAYYQWDLDDFFEEQPYESRLDYEKDGLGPVFKHSEDILNYILNETYLQPSEEYERRRAVFFEGVSVDRISSTIIERMLEL